MAPKSSKKATSVAATSSAAKSNSNSKDNKKPESAPSLLRSASLSTLFGGQSRKRHLEEESHDDEDDDDESEDEIPSKKRKTELDVKRAEFLEKEHKFDEELPEEYRKFRPTGFRFKLPPTDRPVRIYADGVFDLFHLGHMRQLEQSKKALPNVELIVGVPSDFETHKRKGLTVLSDYQRCETLKHCKWVDEVIADAPWCVTEEFLKKHRIDYVAHDDLPYASTDSDDIYKPMKEKGMFLTTQRTDGISTSDIITKIIRDYDKYLMRNFARGATRQELNVSWLKKNELEFKKHINDFRSYMKKTNENINNASRDLYFEVREYLLKNSILTEGNKLKNKKKTISPVADFAASFTGERKQTKKQQQQPKTQQQEKKKPASFIDNIKDWMQKTDSIITGNHPDSADEAEEEGEEHPEIEDEEENEEEEEDEEEEDEEDDETESEAKNTESK
ncbi:hypothetical protein WICPIJ_005428 [Wickerhamomyces pijperi]|uniref:choline-phosphate cytidylyltransferase n=1 Tax=Wickerhamomyces pijperi TaxID=599730 RepID=A0A9P8TLU2_WICPI|nr:hypothetical protein WICPIJ_005428 [Wickerhamomyces pijperi]